MTNIFFLYFTSSMTQGKFIHYITSLITLPTRFRHPHHQRAHPQHSNALIAIHLCLRLGQPAFSESQWTNVGHWHWLSQTRGRKAQRVFLTFWARRCFTRWEPQQKVISFILILWLCRHFTDIATNYNRNNSHPVKSNKWKFMDYVICHVCIN